MSKSYDWKAALTAEVNRLAQESHGRYCRSCYAPLYLCGSQGKLADGRTVWERLSVATDDEIEAREEIHLLSSDTLPRNLTLGALADHIRALLAREPLALIAYAER